MNGTWSAWSSWSSCECGNLIKNRSRTCDNDPPQHGGLACLKNDNVTRSLDETQTQACFCAGIFNSFLCK